MRATQLSVVKITMSLTKYSYIRYVDEASSIISQPLVSTCQNPSLQGGKKSVSYLCDQRVSLFSNLHNSITWFSQFYHLVFTIVIIVTWWGVVGLRILAQHPSTDRRTEPDIKLEFFVFSLFFLLQNLLAPVYDWIHHGMDEREEFGRSFEIEEGFVQEEIRIRVLEANPPVCHQWRLDLNWWWGLTWWCWGGIVEASTMWTPGWSQAASGEHSFWGWWWWWSPSDGESNLKRQMILKVAFQNFKSGKNSRTI